MSGFFAGFLLVIAGAIASFYELAAPPGDWLAVAGFAVLLLAWRPELRRFTGGMLLAMMLAGLQLQWYPPAVAPVAGEPSDMPALIIKVYGLPDIRADQTGFTARVLAGGNNIVAAGDIVLVRWSGQVPVIQAGDVWQVHARLQRWQRVHEPSGRGLEVNHFLLRQNARAELSVRSGGLVEQLPGLADRLHRWRFQLSEQFAVHLAGLPMHGLVSALGLGVRSDITQAQWSVLNATGTTHLMAISGLHVGLFTGWVFWLALQLGKRLVPWFPLVAAQRFAAVCAMLAAVLYAGLAGFSVPTQRALVMCLLGLFVLFRGYRVSPLRFLLLAAVLVLLLDPLALLAPGFYLSFAAVAMIFWLLLYRRGRGAFWQQALVVQLALGLLMLPLGLLLFTDAGARISWLAPVANIVAVPWVSLLVVPFAIVAALTGLFAPAAGVLFATVAAYLLDPLWWLLTEMAQWNRFLVTSLELNTLVMSWLWLAVLMVAAALLFVPRGLPGRPLATVLWVSMLLAVLAF